MIRSLVVLAVASVLLAGCPNAKPTQPILVKCTQSPDKVNRECPIKGPIYQTPDSSRE